MTFDVKAAKAAGYSDAEIQDFLSKNAPKAQESKSFDVEAAKAAGYSDKEIQSFLKGKNVSKLKSVVSAPVKGLIKGSEDISQYSDPVGMILTNLIGKKQDLLPKILEEVLPTKNEEVENFLERAGRIAPTAALGGGGVLSAILGSLGGAALGEVAKEQGIGETGQSAAEAVGLGIPGLAKAIGKGAVNLFKSPIQKLTSGITQPRALGAKFAEKAVVTPGQQEKAIQRLNKEASELTKQTIHKELPIAKQIEEGFNFEDRFEKRFGGLKSVAEKANPTIDITPISELMAKSAKEYKGIPKLHPEGAKVMSEIRAFRANPQTEMKKLLRTYRSNNKKIRNIYETSRLTGKQEEYVDFLVDYNRKIAKSFEGTLPKDSQWIKEFKDMNAEYKQYKDALKTLNHLEGVLGEKATPANIAKLADDKKFHQKLVLSMGEKGAGEVTQIAKDLKSATEAIKRIPAKELKWYEGYIPLSILIPGAKVLSGAYTVKKGLDFTRRGYGWFLSTSKRREVYNDLLKGLASDNRGQFAKAAEEMSKLLKEDSED